MVMTMRIVLYQNLDCDILKYVVKPFPISIYQIHFPLLIYFNGNIIYLYFLEAMNGYI
jgi:hypothetical protein